jgi:hypothetical protein
MPKFRFRPLAIRPDAVFQVRVRSKLILLAVFLCTCLASPAFLRAAGGSSDWPDIPQQDLKMKDDPSNPGAAAIILDRDTITDDVHAYSKYYYRIKVLTDEGKRHADVEIEYRKGDERIEGVQARTIQADGTSVEFNGQIFDKILAKHRRRAYNVKSFTLPDVRVGSIIEYRWTKRWEPLPDYVLHNLGEYWHYVESGSSTAETWVIQDDLFTRRARFFYRPLEAPLSWTWFNLAAGARPQETKEHTIELEVNNIAGLVKESDMPPDGMLRSRVDFFYFSVDMMGSNTPDAFWPKDGKRVAAAADKFIGNPKSVKKDVAEIISDDDAPETKLKKLYAKAQQVRNLSVEDKTEAEEKRDKTKENLNAAAMLKRGYGSGYDINRLYVLLARAAGFDAYIVRAPNRDDHLFRRELLSWRQLDSDLVEVLVGSHSLFLDPGTAHCPFGLLPWEETAVEGIRLDKDDIKFVQTPVPRSSDALIERKGTLQLGDDGTLKGQIQVKYGGQQTLNMRLDLKDSDEAGRRKELEDEVRGWLPGGATVKLASFRNWDKQDQPLEADFDVEVSGFAAATGRRLLLPSGIFEGNEKSRFTHSERLNAVYFHYPWQEVDDIALELPKGYQVENLPQPHTYEQQFGTYTISIAKDTSGVHIRRNMAMEGVMFQPEHYRYLKAFVDKVRAGDDDQMVLRSAGVHASN